MKVAGVILAGGRSSRMGHPKPFIEISGRRMIDIILEKLKCLFDEILIVADKEKDFSSYGCRAVTDKIKGCGPLGGIYTGLKEMFSEAGFFVACDMPYLDTALISEIITEVDFDNECVIPKHSKGIEPLHAVYSRGILPKIKLLLDDRKLSLRELLADCSCKYIDVEASRARSFININTEEDLTRCQSRLFYP